MVASVDQPSNQSSLPDEVLLGKLLSLIDEYNDIQERVQHDRREGLNIATYQVDKKTRRKIPATYKAEIELEEFKKRMAQFRAEVGGRFASIYGKAATLIGRRH